MHRKEYEDSSTIIEDYFIALAKTARCATQDSVIDSITILEQLSKAKILDELGFSVSSLHEKVSGQLRAYVEKSNRNFVQLLRNHKFHDAFHAVVELEELRREHALNLDEFAKIDTLQGTDCFVACIFCM